MLFFVIPNSIFEYCCSGCITKCTTMIIRDVTIEGGWGREGVVRSFRSLVKAVTMVDGKKLQYLYLLSDSCKVILVLFKTIYCGLLYSVRLCYTAIWLGHLRHPFNVKIHFGAPDI